MKLLFKEVFLDNFKHHYSPAERMKRLDFC